MLVDLETSTREAVGLTAATMDLGFTEVDAAFLTGFEAKLVPGAGLG